MSKRTGRVVEYSPYDWEAEPGDIGVDVSRGRAFQYDVSTGRNKRDAGELTPRELKKPGHKATIKDGKLAWIPKEHHND